MTWSGSWSKSPNPGRRLELKEQKNEKKRSEEEGGGRNVYLDFDG